MYCPKCVDPTPGGLVMKELAWLSMPVCALLSQIGGTWWKPARRFGIPIVLGVTLTLSGIMPIKALYAACFLCLMTFLPITVGNGDVRKWYQFVWLWVLGYLLGLGSLLIGPQGFILAFLPCLVYGGLATLSNLSCTRKYVPWKFFEGFAWCAVLYPYLIQI